MIIRYKEGGGFVITSYAVTLDAHLMYVNLIPTEEGYTLALNTGEFYTYPKIEDLELKLLSFFNSKSFNFTSEDLESFNCKLLGYTENKNEIQH